MKTGIELISEERHRQVSDEGWTPEHDDQHKNWELSSAACCYAQMGSGGPYSNPTPEQDAPNGWPWDDEWWKPSADPIRNLVKSGALIAAEIDRLQRRPTPMTNEMEKRAREMAHKLRAKFAAGQIAWDLERHLAEFAAVEVKQADVLIAELERLLQEIDNWCSGENQVDDGEDAEDALLYIQDAIKAFLSRAEAKGEQDGTTK